jgi:ABC-type transporter Mla subunit MlaD
MSEDVFRIVVTAAVALAAIAFIVQAAAIAGLYRAVRRMAEKTNPLTGKLQELMEKAGPAIEKIAPVIDQMGVVIDKMGPVVESAGPLVARAGGVFDAAQLILDENRPRVAEITGDVARIVKSGRLQVQEVGELLHDASGRALARLEQIDRSVESTVEQVELVGDAVKRAVTRPARELNGIAAGVSAAMSTLVHGRKHPVDQTTQDEEMFI